MTSTIGERSRGCSESPCGTEGSFMSDQDDPSDSPALRWLRLAEEDLTVAHHTAADPELVSERALRTAEAVVALCCRASGGRRRGGRAALKRIRPAGPFDRPDGRNDPLGPTLRRERAE